MHMGMWKKNTISLFPEYLIESENIMYLLEHWYFNGHKIVSVGPYKGNQWAQINMMEGVQWRLAEQP